MVDVALGIEALVPAAEYFGSTVENTKESFDALDWKDARKKPTWAEVQAAYDALPDEVKNPLPYAEKKKEDILAKLGLTADEVTALLA